MILGDDVAEAETAGCVSQAIAQIGQERIPLLFESQARADVWLKYGNSSFHGIFRMAPELHAIGDLVVEPRLRFVDLQVAQEADLRRNGP
jgi:hypothetical protein